MSYSKTIDYLYSLQKYGIKFGLDNIKRLMHIFDNPHTSFCTIHVAGTNGKGSTSNIIASILSSAGLKVGLFTSPHLISFTERIRVNNEEIKESEVIELAEEVRSIIEGIRDFSPTFFEVITTMAFLYFKKKKVDIAVVEVGMGGRLDATNIIIPEIAVITNIDYDHREFLGNTLEEIAQEKAGIIKDNVPVITSLQKKEVLEIIEQVAKKRNSKLYVYGRDFYSILNKEDISGLSFDYFNGNLFAIKDIDLPLMGEYQMQNASVAIKATMTLLDSFEFSKVFSQKRDIISIIREGISGIFWQGRLEIVKSDPLIIIDGAHNPYASKSLSKTIKKNFSNDYKRIIVVLGIMGDKDLRGIIEPILSIASEVILTAPCYHRAAVPEALAEIVKSFGFHNIRIIPKVKDAIKVAQEISKDRYQSNSQNSKTLILVTGSFYTIGEVKESLGNKGVLTRLRE